MKFILGTKEKMTEYFSPEGAVIPVTVISAGPVVVTQIKNKKSDGYNAVQVGFGQKNSKNLSKAIKGHLKELGNFRYLKEFRLLEEEKFKVGDTLNVADVFAVGDKLQVSSVSKGKGFQGVVKRHGFKGGPRTHGQKHSEREAGSIGGGLRTHVPRGMRMAGRMGSDRITQKNLKVIFIDKENRIMLIKGAIPGVRGSLVEIVAK
ncbi:50S ribosomal protein L3 [Candidatus Nomurabacteria bacterium RIFCSPHIGHO2_01_FULL_38_19]|uniref:Large ribosomal subunit protein uL3 n=1 Tax=Candidatus Nomurabacteria bacterium RIFCSPHIGHO2_01_FULL_38_19 TaxID=1801732 RepID=A0A1F6UVE5_9BACT|nr:MAG: 50S ribosomal protein L3 [Candidatus Nomurabacteria bacterium RIFCSPHIGHO2_01_FULL_38_19]